jgi:hypothetical protein
MSNLFARALGIVGVVLVATATSAQNTYLMTGKAGSSTGVNINLPASGSTPCPSIINFEGRIPVTGPHPVTPPITSTVTYGGALRMFTPANPLGCIPGSGTVTTTGAGTGGAFTFPAGFFSQPLPGTVRAVPVPNVPRILQLATSIQFTGPQAVPFQPVNPTMGLPTTAQTGGPPATATSFTNLANFRQFRAGAWTSQTGRAGASFTWCAGNPGCTTVGQATALGGPGIVKYTAGGNQFGGTMGLVLTTGPNTSSLAITGVVPVLTGEVGLNVLGGMGSRAAGRGYAAYQTTQLQMGPIYAMYTLTSGVNMLIGMVSGGQLGSLPAGTNRNWGFAFTTGTVLVRETGTAQGNPLNFTLTVMGSDTVTSGGNRNLQLVAGHMAKSTVQGNNATPVHTVIRLLPEPGAPVQVLAAVGALLGMALFRGRRSR